MRRNWRTILLMTNHNQVFGRSLTCLEIPGERYSDGLVMQVDRFGGGSLCWEEFISGERQIWLWYGKT